MVHQNTIKLTDFGLSKRIGDKEPEEEQLLFGIVPYIDSKRFTTPTYLLNEKSDVYSIGVLLWEISSGKIPFHDYEYDVNLAWKISQGQREIPIFGTGTPDGYVAYVKLYTGK